MIDTATPQELERRKAIKLRLRRDLAVEAQKYEGRTFYVVKDPVSLRYYRLKDNEHFLLQFLDGKHTLEEAQKAYEKRYRPERLKLEDLEGVRPAAADGRPGSERIAAGRQAAFRSPQETPPHRVDADADQHPLHQDPDLRPGPAA